jgi:hypothetical protein
MFQYPIPLVSGGYLATQMIYYGFEYYLWYRSCLIEPLWKTLGTE